MVPKENKNLPPEVRKMNVRIHLLLAHISLMRSDPVQCLNILSLIDNEASLTKNELFYIQCYKAESYCRQGVPKMVRKGDLGNEATEGE